MSLPCTEFVSANKGKRRFRNVPDFLWNYLSLRSYDHDGLIKGYDHKIFENLDKKFELKLICSGGLKTYKDIKRLYQSTKIRAFSMSSVFHYTQLTPLILKKQLHDINIPVRL